VTPPPKYLLGGGPVDTGSFVEYEGKIWVVHRLFSGRHIHLEVGLAGSIGTELKTIPGSHSRVVYPGPMGFPQKCYHNHQVEVGPWQQ
jgi:hypothetical protein